MPRRSFELEMNLLEKNGRVTPTGFLGDIKPVGYARLDSTGRPAYRATK